MSLLLVFIGVSDMVWKMAQVLAERVRELVNEATEDVQVRELNNVVAPSYYPLRVGQNRNYVRCLTTCIRL